MTSAQEILKMIEEVSPDDTAKLDEIDARVTVWLEGYDWGSSQAYMKNQSVLEFYSEEGLEHRYYISHYTRSRDALKQIRPEGFLLREFQDVNGKWQAGLYKPSEAFVGTSSLRLWLPTEELAELHAIIQAIEYERRGK